jgi:hypothetical protein
MIRIYKSGKYYLVRSTIKTSPLTLDPSVKIYNENEIPVSFQEITPETEMMTILEIQGIKFTSRNFQMEMELKQMMVLQEEPLFENCLIRTSKKEFTSNSLEKKLEFSQQDSSVEEFESETKEETIPVLSLETELPSVYDTTSLDLSLEEKKDDSIDKDISLDLVMEELDPMILE